MKESRDKLVKANAAIESEGQRVKLVKEKMTRIAGGKKARFWGISKGY